MLCDREAYDEDQRCRGLGGRHDGESTRNDLYKDKNIMPRIVESNRIQIGTHREASC